MTIRPHLQMDNATFLDWVQDARGGMSLPEGVS